MQHLFDYRSPKIWLIDLHTKNKTLVSWNHLKYSGKDCLEKTKITKEDLKKNNLISQRNQTLLKSSQ